MGRIATEASRAPTVERCALDGVLLITPRRYGDSRGHFSETYNKEVFDSLGVNARFVQDNQSFSSQRGTIRGMHFQVPPHAQAKLVRVVRGAIFDAVVDLRAAAPTRGHWAGFRLSASDGGQLFVPRGFAHGFCTLEPDTEVIYKVDDYYSRDHERGVRWNDTEIAIRWPDEADESTLVERDRHWPAFGSLPPVF